MLGEQILGTAWNVFLLLEVQVLDFSENCHQLRQRKVMGKVGVSSVGQYLATQVKVCPLDAPTA